ncbi:DMT family transporter [Cytophagales bacterium LB-30]|uniref:DMT family transporter n=1 Tax=Shiella aurantiaca TaxID=3058365 RepID=A0ABT8F6G6_9BACT|nr:DMT family transporter [Shiella aurantiaca]MDN4166066.1 DMT family transporter [Shiella aurantiaca]
MEKKVGAQAWVFFALLALIWGSSFILIKRGLLAFSAMEVGALRIVAASVVLTPFALPAFKTIKKQHIPRLLSVGLLGSFFPAFLFALAQTRLNSSVTGVLNGLTPIFVLLIGYFAFKQPITLRSALGVLVGFGGTTLLILAGNSSAPGEINYYALFVVLATFFYGLNLNVIKYYLPDLPALAITSMSLVMVGPLSALILFGFTDFVPKLSQDPQALNSMLYVVLLGVMGTAIALILFNKMVKIATPLFASSVTYAIPVVAVIWGLFDGESLLPLQMLGMAAILLGVYIANRKKG